MQLQDKIVLITGSSSGIGKEIAISCAKLRCRLLLHYRSNKEGVLETLREVERYSSGSVYQADLSNYDEVKKLFFLIKKDVSSIDILINNAGEALPGELDNFDLWEMQWKNIFMSQVYTTNQFLSIGENNILRKIINISSIYGLDTMENVDFPQYSAMKAAVNSFMRTVAKKFSPFVLVNSVAPGYTWTRAWHGTSEQKVSLLESRTRIKRFIEPEEVAQVVTAILENDAITGEVIRIDGGLHLHP